MKNFSVLLFVTLIVASLVLYLVSFQVRETEVAIVTTWGKPAAEPITEPGWKFKWPVPVQKVYKFDSRPRIYAGVQEETSTRGGEPIIVDSYILWRIDDCSKFLVAAGTYEKAQQLLSTELRNAQNAVVGQFYFSEFINSDADKIKLDEIEKQMTAALSNAATQSYGIKIESVGIRKLKVDEKATENVFARMREDRNRKKEAILKEGQAQATKIVTEADSMRKELLAAADARAKAIRGQGDAEAARYYKLLEADPDFAIFLRDLEALKNILSQRSTLVLDQQADPIMLLKQAPNLVPNK